MKGMILQIIYKQSDRLKMRNEINLNGRAFKYQFDLEIQKIVLLKTIEIPKSSYLEVVWRRKQKNISTKVKPEVRGTQQQIFFGETLSMISTCFLNNDNLEFGPKDSTVSVVIFIQGAQKLFGSLNINLSSVLNPRNYQERGVKLIEQQLNGRAKSKIYLKLSASFITEMAKSDDQQSIGSGVHSNSYNNTSTYSIMDNRRLGDIPSKDTYSVLSYGGAMRYSARKEDTISQRREDSNKKIEEYPSKEYSNYGYTVTNFYNRPSNQYNLTRGGSSIQTPAVQPPSANRLPRSSDSDQNRSSLGEQNSRLLIQQQTKRSKLQAQNTKVKVEIDEVKNKLNEYVRENMRLKQQLKKFTENNDSRQAEIKKENEELKDRNYVLSSEVRELKARFQKYIVLERECSMVKNERDNLVRQLHQHEDSMNNMRTELQELKKQLTRARESESRMYNEMKEIKTTKLDNQQAKRREFDNMKSQLEYYQNSVKEFGGVRQQQENKIKNLQAKVKNYEILLDNHKTEHYTKMDELTAMKNREINELNEKLQQKNQQCTKYIVEAQKVKGEMSRIKDQKITELQVNKSILSAEVQRLNSVLKEANSRIESLEQERNSLNNQVKNEVVMRSKETQRSRQLQQKLNQTTMKHQMELNDLRRGSQQLQMQNIELNKLLSEKSKTLDEVRGDREQLEHLIKQNLEFELQLKYKSQEIAKYIHLEQDYEKLKCKLGIEQKNMRELNEELQKCQRQLKEKNRSYLIECEKSKMLAEERANNARAQNQLKEALSQVKAELQQKQNIIFNGERQVQQMDCYIGDLENRNRMLMQELNQVKEQASNVNQEKYLNEIRTLQARNKQLQARDSEKIKTIQNLNKNLGTSSTQIKELQALTEQRYQQLVQKDQVIGELQSKLRELQTVRNVMDQDLNAFMNEKKTLTKKNQMIMEELFSYKRKFQQQKGRSVSTVHIRTSQQYIKIKNLQNELQKKESQIRKMEKEMMVLESQNINLNIQVMRKLEETTPQ